ncbi:glutathione S-transferase family protein [Mesobacterium sp. TK19101]|uniref:Glutathione S-transferase family protein n=1 Tax=Mesobacterium hydrothermale TaxID=3111907 RepID=A0ABU6HLG4_9RHOB|nr:glutathione S-transferase family protein [Mesobacterium sp. TK19101]MEC3863294.1 glutathione S-transferase family protein [Mesobacterium sp. TK19101]
MSEIIFYTNPMSRGRTVRWMLEELGQPYETRVLDYGSQMKSPDYLAINPMGKVPTVQHGLSVVTEAAACCAYLAAAFPEAGLAPAPGTPESAAYLRWMFFAAGPSETAITNAAFGFDLPDDPQVRGRSGYGSLELVADTLASMLSDGRDYVTGEEFSAADVYVGSQILWGRRLDTLPDRPGFAEYTLRLTARPAAVRAREIDNALMPPPS